MAEEVSEGDDIVSEARRPALGMPLPLLAVPSTPATKFLSSSILLLSISTSTSSGGGLDRKSELENVAVALAACGFDTPRHGGRRWPLLVLPVADSCSDNREARWLLLLDSVLLLDLRNGRGASLFGSDVRPKELVLEEDLLAGSGLLLGASEEAPGACFG